VKTLLDSILFFGAMGLFVIGVYESITKGITSTYWIFMISLSLLFLYGYRKNRNEEKSLKAKKNAKPRRQKKRK
jgi:general stress protein CsbA